MKHLKYSALGLATLFIITSCQSRSSKNESKTMNEAWEYMEVLHIDFPKDELNQLGAEGWELVAVTPRQPHSPRFILKRKLSKSE